mmetsp:Transcript_15923/g.23641  ORF Transcript_15923/g.23641 Transcript_15923/m.23641 type:complete len:238 (-) Transcript_15923:603-1316(-)
MSEDSGCPSVDVLTRWFHSHSRSSRRTRTPTILPPIVWSSSSVHVGSSFFFLLPFVYFSRNRSANFIMLYWTSNHSMFESRSRNGDVVTFCALNLNASSIASIVIGCNDCDGDAFSSTVSTFSTLFSTLSSILFSTPLTSLAPPNKASQISSDKKSTSIQGKITPFLLKPGPSISCRNIANKLLARLYLSCSSNKQAASIAAATSRICLTTSSLPDCNICSSFGRAPKSKITSSLIS